MKIQDHFYTRSTKPILVPIVYYKSWWIHDQYDEEAAYKDNNEAFDAGVAALKKILDEEGLSYE